MPTTRKRRKLRILEYFAFQLRELDLAARRSTEYSARHFRLYGIVAFVSPFVTYLDYLVANPSYNTLGIRLLAIPVALPALYYDKLPPVFKDYFHWYFVFAATFLFPYSFGIMLTLNSATTPDGAEVDILWILQYFIIVFVFIQVIYSGVLASLLWLLSAIASVSTLWFIEDPNWAEVSRVLTYPIAAYLSAIALGVLTDRKTDVIDTERFKAAWAIGANAAHELRTPLATIRALSSGSNKLLPTLVDGYEKAKAAGLEVEPLRPRQIEELRKVLESIQNEVQYSNTIIDMILTNTADKPLGAPDSATFSVRECIEEAVDRYPFNNSDEKRLVRIRIEDDFEMTAPKLLVIHTLFNLIKNGLQYVQKKPGATVEISAQRLNDSDQIVVHDSGPGISSFNLPHVFDRFYTTSRTGESAGIGLSFCKMVMERVGGEIACDSVEGEFTTFTLTFPHGGIQSIQP